MTNALTMSDKAALAWGQQVPDWVAELAQMATNQGLNACAERLDCSSTTLSQTINNKYPGDLSKLEAKVRGALMGETVICPILGKIGRDRCLLSQALPKAVTNSVRTRLYRACRSGCPNSRLKGGGYVS